MVAMDDTHCFTEPGAGEVLGGGLDAGAGTPVKSPTPKRHAFIVLDDFWANHAMLRGDFRGMRAREVDENVLAYFADTFGVERAAILTRWQLQRCGRALFSSAQSQTPPHAISLVYASGR